MPMIPPRGVKKVNESILQEGRAIIITEEEAANLDWSQIPDGSLKINPKTGVMSVKLEGETTWVPAGIKNDGTICIAKDSRIAIETFTVVTVDNDDGTFTYANEKGEYRHKPKTTEGYFVFELEEGTYLKRRNHLEVIIDDCLFRSPETGGIIELTEKRFAVAEQLTGGQKITAKYVQVFEIGNPYPRFFLDENEPKISEVGDFWLDFDADIMSDEQLPTTPEGDVDIDWSQIKGKPTTLAGYGITDNVAKIGHVHRVGDITDFPTSMPANGGNADTVGGYAPGVGPNKLVVTDATGKIPDIFMPSGIAVSVKGLTTPPTSNNSAPNVLVRTNAKGEIEIDFIRLGSAVYPGSSLANVFIDIGDGVVRKMPLGNFKLVANMKEITVQTGTVAHGGTIPLPPGYDQSQCYWIVTPRINYYYAHGDARDERWLGMYCYADSNRKVYVYGERWYGSIITKYGTADYIIIGVK